MRNTLRSKIMNRTMRLALSGILAAGFAAQVSGQAFIVEDGQPKAAIVIAEQPTRMQNLAAEELQKYVKKISGAELPIGAAHSDELPVTIYIGESEFTRKLGLKTDDLKYGAYRIKSGNDYLALVGNDDDFFMDKPGDAGPEYPNHRRERKSAAEAWEKKHGKLWSTPFSSSFKSYNAALGVWSVDEYGSLNAVNDFLRSLGVRWYMPGDFGEVCPTMSSIALPEIDETARPEWSQRDVAFHGCNPFQVGADEMLWRLRLGLYSDPGILGGHGTDKLISTDKVIKEHPEFFARFGNTRATGKPCYSSQGLFDSALGFSKLMFDEYGKDVVSLMPTDAYTAFCQCPLCKGKETPARGFKGMMSDYVWDFMNRAAAETARTHPDKQIMNYAYNTYLLPPEGIEQFHPNLRVGICGSRKGFGNPADKKMNMAIREGFLEKIPSGKISLWEYYNVAPGSYFPRIIAEDLKWLKGKIDGTMIEFTRSKRISENDPEPDERLAASHLNLWLTTRLWWNPDAEELWWNKGRGVEALLDEYYENFYGPAAQEMKAFIEFCEQNWPMMRVKPEPIETSFDLIARARDAAGEDNIHARRVQLVMNSLEPLKIIRDQLKVGRSDNPVARFTEIDDLSKIKLDGKLDEPFWNDLETFELKEIVAGGEMPNKTTFKVAWAGDSLYFGIRCEEEAMDRLVVPAQGDNDNSIFDGDSIEILLETPTHAYYQIAIDPEGHVNDLDRPNSIIIGKTGRYETKWEAGIDVAIFKGKDFWSVEAKIPALGAEQEELLPFFGVSGDKPTKDAPWYFNVGRVRHADTGKAQVSAFSPTGHGGFHYMKSFARLQPE